jgi:MFS family permease
MIYYAPTIFGQLGLDGNTTSLLATGVYGIVNCLSTLPALFFIDKIGRRVLLMAGATGTCISLVIVGGILGGYGSSLMDHKSAGWAGIAFIYIYDINFSYSFGKCSYSRCLALDLTTNFLPSSHWLGPSF